MYLKDFADPANFPNRVRQLPKEFLKLPDIDALPRGSYSGSAPFHAPLELVAHTLLQRILVGYDKNRGNQPINQSQIKKWYGKNGEGVSVEALDEIAFGESKHGDSFTLAKWHHRACLVLQMFWMAPDRIWNKIKDELISCRVYDVKKLVPLYVADNAGFKQSKDSFLKNPDMVLGSIVSCDPDPDGKFNGRLASRLSVPARTLLGSKSGYLQPVANLLYALHVKTCTYAKSGEVVNLIGSPANVYNCRTKVKKFVEMPRKENQDAFQVSDDILDAVAEAIEDYLSFLSFFKSEVDVKRAARNDVSMHKKIIAQTAFFAFFIYDRVIFKMLPSANLVAERLAYHIGGASDIDEIVNLLWTSDTKLMNKRADQIVTTLRKRLSSPTKNKK